MSHRDAVKHKVARACEDDASHLLAAHDVCVVPQRGVVPFGLRATGQQTGGRLAVGGWRLKECAVQLCSVGRSRYGTVETRGGVAVLAWVRGTVNACTHARMHACTHALFELGWHPPRGGRGCAGH